MQFVRLVNTGTTPYDFHQANKKRILQPGEEAMVPWDVATSLFGDPFTVDTVKEPARTRAWQQATGIHNYGSIEGDSKLLQVSAAELWEQRRPKIQVYDVETGNRIYMVIEDQDGTMQNGQEPAPLNDQLNVAFLTQQIADMQKTIATLVQVQLATMQTTPAVGQTETASTDGAGVDAPSGFDLPTAGATAPSTPVTPPIAAEAGADTPPVSTPQPADQPSADTPQAVPAGKPAPRGGNK
jgi:hypothetical protein